MNKRYLIITALLTFNMQSIASEIMYTPINPSFGGSPLNGSFLMNKAQGQNKHKAPVTVKSYSEKFKSSLERAYLSKLVRQITQLAFNDDNEDNPLYGKDSTFTSGDYEIEIITSNSDAITVRVTNTVNDEVTIIEIPRFGG